MHANVMEEKLYEQYRKKEKTATIDANEVEKLNRPFTPLGKIVSALAMIVLILAIWRFTARAEYIHLLGGLMLAYLVLKEIFALIYMPCTNELTKNYKVSVILTCFNEDPTSVVSILENILALDYPVHEVIFLDDGSKDPLAFRVAESFARDHRNAPGAPQFQLIRFEENRGKRAVMIDGFLKATGDYIFMLDSDSEILPNALTELLRPFEDNKTTSVVGNIGILNKGENFLTRVQSITYFGAFQLGRSAQSVTGSVTVCSGAFSVHKKDFILQNIEEFKISTFFGVEVSAGDDRALTAISKMSGGKTRYQNTAYCETMAPNTWRKFQKQRRRWQRSGFICSLGSIIDMFPRRLWFLFWVFAEAYFWLIATVIFIVTVISRGFYLDVVDVILYFGLIMYKHNIFYLLYRPLSFLFTPIYFLAYGLSLTFTRIHASFTINNDDWGTRAAKEDGKRKVCEEENGIVVNKTRKVVTAITITRDDRNIDAAESAKIQRTHSKEKGHIRERRVRPATV